MIESLLFYWRRNCVAIFMVIVSVSGLLFGCASVARIFVPDEIHVPLDDIERAMNKRFPLERDLIRWIKATVNKPQLQLRPDLNKIQASFDMVVSARTGKTWRGRVTLLSGLRFDNQQYAVYLKNPEITELDLAIPSLLDWGAKNWIMALIETQLDQVPVYTVSPEKIRQYGQYVEIQNIAVVSDGLKIDLKPKNKGE